MLRTLSPALIRGQRVILRADFDVALKGGRVSDDFRIAAHLPAIRFLRRHGAKIRIVAHLGRPHGRRIAALSFRKLARHFGRVLSEPMLFVADPLDSKALLAYDGRSETILFENIRFWPQEEANDRAFAKRLSRWGDVYVNEAFADSHRCHASVVALAKRLPAAAGFHLAREVENIERVRRNPRRPLVAVLGGAKLETKLPLIERFLRLGGDVLLGGTLANTLLLARGFAVGRSTVDRKLMKELRRRIVWHSRLHLPFDVRAGKSASGSSRLVAVADIEPDEIIFDIGPRTGRAYGRIIGRGRTIVWNGPLGLAEESRFSRGTVAIARLVQRSSGFSVVGGGDTVAALERYRLCRGFGHVSTGGGAMLAYLAGEKMPGLEALKA